MAPTVKYPLSNMLVVCVVLDVDEVVRVLPVRLSWVAALFC